MSNPAGNVNKDKIKVDTSNNFCDISQCEDEIANKTNWTFLICSEKFLTNIFFSILRSSAKTNSEREQNATFPIDYRQACTKIVFPLPTIGARSTRTREYGR